MKGLVHTFHAWQQKVWKRVTVKLWQKCWQHNEVNCREDYDEESLLPLNCIAKMIREKWLSRTAFLMVNLRMTVKLNMYHKHCVLFWVWILLTQMTVTSFVCVCVCLESFFLRQLEIKLDTRLTKKVLCQYTWVSKYLKRELQRHCIILAYLSH